MQKSIYIHHNKKRLLALSINSLLLFLPLILIGLWANYSHPDTITNSKAVFALFFVIFYTYLYFPHLSHLQSSISKLINPQPAFIVNKDGLFNLFSPHLPPFIRLGDIKAVTFLIPPPLHPLLSYIHIITNHQTPQPFLVIKKRQIYETAKSTLIFAIIGNSNKTIIDLTWPLYPTFTPQSVSLEELLLAIKELQTQNNNTTTPPA